MSFQPINGINQTISPIQSLGAGKLKSGGEKEKYSFNNVIMSHIKQVSDAANKAVEMKDKLVRGELKNTHAAAISGLKAGVMLRLTTHICSKVSSAATTLFQMQI